MSPEFVIGYMRSAIELTLALSLPILLTGLAVGVLVSIIQAATQIQEQTLTFIPKLCVIFGMLIFTFPWLLERLSSFTTNLLINLPQYVR